ncbi:Polyadenylate-binding protein RBP47A [Capsicum baccatum]|uniref:Polyadenylate-binding protein RBP47A n=1 Tax=Capsicum baccatum TaxID=33114 RepID=A0A2G2VN35_CAPBA|nr:Polyadenylate-binding protein RBP47A [Capsicum baccatum]
MMRALPSLVGIVVPEGNHFTVASFKVIHNKQTGFSQGNRFVDFFTHASVEKVLQTYSCMAIPNVEQPFHLNWATFCMGDKRANKVVFATLIFFRLSL